MTFSASNIRLEALVIFSLALANYWAHGDEQWACLSLESLV
jgi:hypothetical protein